MYQGVQESNASITFKRKYGENTDTQLQIVDVLTTSNVAPEDVLRVLLHICMYLPASLSRAQIRGK